MQKILMIGYVGRDPELKYSPQGAVVAQFSIASTEGWKDKNGESQERTEWFAIKAFGRRAEIAGEYLHKGSRVYLEGRKRTESWEDKKAGGKNYRISFTLTGLSSWIHEQTTMRILDTMRPATREAQFRTKKCRSKRISFIPTVCVTAITHVSKTSRRSSMGSEQASTSVSIPDIKLAIAELEVPFLQIRSNGGSLTRQETRNVARSSHTLMRVPMRTD